MRVVKSIKVLRKLLRKEKLSNHKIGFVPTMGSLHEGHLSLIRNCRRENEISILSIFINPKQFVKGDDFSSYPREEKKDIFLAKKENIDIIFFPTNKEMYSDGHSTVINVEKLSTVLCGKYRPGHFQGVTTVVGKLLNIIEPDTLYLGQKDAQQAIILKKMIDDLNWPVKVNICPTVREKNGLAMSSRNQYLSDNEKKEASILFRSLKEAKHTILSGQRDSKKIIQSIRNLITKNSSAKIQYIECVNADTLEKLTILKGKMMIALAVHLGRARLIDNIQIAVK